MEQTRKNRVRRGGIYIWREGRADERRVVIVGGEHRGRDKLISVLMFGDSDAGTDVVEISSKVLGNTRYLHCGMITYVARTDLSDDLIDGVTFEEMQEIEEQFYIQYGLDRSCPAGCSCKKDIEELKKIMKD